MLNIDREYNLLNDCRYIRNKDRCIHDTNCGFEAVFSRGDCGFSNNVGADWHWAEGRFLWGTSTASDCYIALDQILSTPFEADFFTDLELDMLIRCSEGVTQQTTPESFTARLVWSTESDPVTPSDSQADFEVYPDGEWHKYKFTMLTYPKWVGNCHYLELHPFIDGYPNVEIIIQRLAFTSDTHYKCNYAPCAYNRHYKHICQGRGTYAKAYSTQRKRSVLVDEDNCRLGVSIDGYGAKYIDLDLSHCTDCWAIAQEITLKLNTLSYGGYKFAECYYNEVDENFTIYTGTRGRSGGVLIYHGGEKDVTERLGFFSSPTTPTYRTEGGINAADGFVEAYQKQPSTVLYRLPSGDVTTINFDPQKPMVEIGRSDLLSFPREKLLDEGNVEGSLFIDIFGGASYHGKIDKIWYKGAITERSNVVLLRPVSDTQFTIKYSEDISDARMKPGQESLYEIVVDWELKPGDVFGLFMCLPAISTEENAKARPEMYYKYSWVEKFVTNLTVGSTIDYNVYDIKFYGYQSLPVYGFSSTKVPGIGIEAELRWEYGVSHVAIKGDTEEDTFEWDLIKSGVSQVRASSNLGQGTLQLAHEADLMLDFNPEDVDAWWLEFWFPGFIHDIFKIQFKFEESENIRAFALEGYIEENFRSGLSWDGSYNMSTDAPYLGSQVGWIRLDPPLSVTANGMDVSNSLYLASSYVTNDPFDYYPGLTDDLRYYRSQDAYSTYWNTLEYTYSPFPTHGVKLYVWKWASAKITSVSIWSKFSSLDTIIRAVDGSGFSGPQVFDTEKYNIVDTQGQVWSSSNISRAKTTEYQYDLIFDFLEDDESIIVAPVGTTLSKLDLDFKTFPAKIKQIKLIPQHLATQVRTVDGDDAITEITNMSWGAPSDGSEFTYGPTKSYKICNDTGHHANLLIGVADPLAIDNACVFASNLESTASVEDPFRGCAAQLVMSPDSPLCNHRGINYHAKSYAILDETPVNWYSSTNEGVTWQLLTSGSPFTDPFKWNEPTDPFNNVWKVYGWCRTTSMVVNSGTLTIAQPARSFEFDLHKWLNPTYFIEADKDTTLSIEAMVPRCPEFTPGVDTSVGIVIFDNYDLSKYFRIERCTGNGILTASGYVSESNLRYEIPFGDYVRCGDQDSFYSVSGSLPKLTLIQQGQYPLLLRLDKSKTGVDVRYKMFGSWVTVSSYDISGWSDYLRVGTYAGGEAVSSLSHDVPISAQIDYVSYKESSNKVAEYFDYYSDLSDIVTTNGTWVALNANDAVVLSSSSDGLHIKPWKRSNEANFFDYRLLSPALATEWGSITDYGTVVFRLSEFEDNATSSGVFSAGMLLRDSSNHYNNIKLAVRSSSLLEVKEGLNSYFTTISAADTASGIWLRMRKGGGSVTLSYSYEGTFFNTLSGISILDWSSTAPIDFVISSDINRSVLFDNIQFGSSSVDSTHLSAQFDPPICLLESYGRGTTWSEFEYAPTTTSGLVSYVTTTATGTVGFTNIKPDEISYVKFRKSQDVEVELDSVKFIPDPYMSRKKGRSVLSTEIFNGNKQLFDISGDMKLVDPPQMTESGTGWTNSDSLSYKGLPMYDYPVIALDFGASYHIGRCPLATNLAKGRFSNTETDLFLKVNWEPNSVDEAGFHKRCIYSSHSNECTADYRHGKPKMIYGAGEIPNYYFAGPCDGWSTEAGNVNQACPLYTCGEARWLLLESKDYLSTSPTATGIWFIGPIEVSHFDRPKYITDNINWWSTNFGLMQWVDNTEWDPTYTMIYSYPGLNIEGSCFFNGDGSPYWRLASDQIWTWEDIFSIDFKLSHPQNINSLSVKVGRDPDCFYMFTVTGTLAQTWTTHQWTYKDSQMVIRGDKGLEEPSYTQHDIEVYVAPETPYMPLPYLSMGYIEITASGNGGCDIYFKNLSNKRTRFVDDFMFLGTEEAIYIPDLDIENTGTLEFDYLPSQAAINLVDGDPRTFLYTVATISNANAGICLALDLRWGWALYCFSPEESLVYVSLPSLKEAERIIPTATNPGPFHIVLSWAPPWIPGLMQTEAVCLWVNGIKTCSGRFETLGKYITTDDVRVMLGKGTTILHKDDTDPYAAYAGFSKVRIYKHAISNPSVDVDSTSLIPENLIELSTDGINWKSFLNGDLPLYYPGIENGDCCTVYMRNKRPQKEIKKLHKRETAYLMVKWEVTGVG
jgi:hypothetical protein